MFVFSRKHQEIKDQILTTWGIGGRKVHGVEREEKAPNSETKPTLKHVEGSCSRDFSNSDLLCKQLYGTMI